MVHSHKIKLLLKKMSIFGKINSIKRAITISRNPFIKSSPPGHFYSPIPDLDYIKNNRESIFSENKTYCPGIEIRVKEQLELIKELATYYSEIPFTEKIITGNRYFYSNPFFGHGSSIILYSLIRHFKPSKIVEVGSGYSSAAMLDVNDKFFDGKIQITFVEPYPERLYSLMSERDREKHKTHIDIAQNV